ncbi:MAG: cytidine deaminase [Bacteroidales bacterium]|nr:cytidine deaminase [Bacteroidales bacterium]MDY5789785.1 cytidine deaminase [Candidatus Onthomorpha sp.]
MTQESFKTTYLRFESIDELNKDEQDLVKAAYSALSKSYSPYSCFKVGAAVRLSDGTIVQGTNQENSAYPSGLCAERTALFAAGMKDASAVSLAVVAKTNQGKDASAYPCGACRQVMSETEKRYGNKLSVIVGLKDGGFIKFDKVSDLLPFEFDF